MSVALRKSVAEYLNMGPVWQLGQRPLATYRQFINLSFLEFGDGGPRFLQSDVDDASTSHLLYRPK